ncbi:tropinone reductase-like 1 [Pistacia vera]|uniref:tropinone reductase-like 1 n=1 Tax=Pistacia vera TaxID=55513 RepID=UPI0012636663|nr:tropinone reductase-like 1 [Pistacia vera]
MEYVPFKLQIVDILTKALSISQFQELKQKLTVIEVKLRFQLRDAVSEGARLKILFESDIRKKKKRRKINWFNFIRLEGKVVIITGGAHGLGATTVRLFHQHGAKVVIADIQDHLGQAITKELGENVCYIHCDVTNEDDISNLVDTTIAKYGKLDIMFSNAGVVDRPSGSILDTPNSDLERVINVNTIGAFLAAKHAARVMAPQRKGCIIFTASLSTPACTSIAGLSTPACTSIAGLSTPAYAVSKYGILGLAKSLAAELGGCGIRVNCVSPYAVMNSIQGLSEVEVAKGEAIMSAIGNLKGQVLRAEGVAQAALYLASDEANYVSGLNLVVDGGFSIVNPTLIMARDI